MAVSRREFGALSLSAVAASLLAACSSAPSVKSTTPAASPPKLLWSDEFERLDLVTAANPNGAWAPREPNRPVGLGYPDLGASGTNCWLATPEQELGGTAYNPFSVADSVLSITARPTPASALADAHGCPWLGGLLVSNTNLPAFRFGYGYYEFRMRFPVTGKGMFPALWFYAAHGTEDAKAGAEIDLVEVFGDADGQPWNSSLHALDSERRGPQQEALISEDEDTKSWHTYGMEWTEEHLSFYRDRVLVRSVTGDMPAFFAGTQMSIRMDYSMNAEFFSADHKSDSSTPSELTMEVDYVRKYDKAFS